MPSLEVDMNVRVAFFPRFSQEPPVKTCLFAVILDDFSFFKAGKKMRSHYFLMLRFLFSNIELL